MSNTKPTKQKQAGKVAIATEKIATKVDKAKEIVRLFDEAKNAWVQAGEIVVSMLDDDAMSADQISRMTKLGIDTINKLERVGRYQIIPELLSINPTVAKPLSRLTYSEQKRVLEEGVDVLGDNGEGTMHLHVKSLTQKQCSQAFDSVLGVRDLDAQRSWQERVQAPPVKLVGMPWTIVNGAVVFNKGCRLTRKEVEVIVTQLPK